MIFVQETEQMITKMTWAQYFTATGILIIVYYSVVVLIFYRDKVRFFLKSVFGNGNKQSIDFSLEVNKNDQAEYDFEENLYPFLHDVHETLQQASVKKFIVEEIILSIQITMSKYPIETLLDKKEAINHYIKTESKKICSIFLDDERLRQLWIR